MKPRVPGELLCHRLAVCRIAEHGLRGGYGAALYFWAVEAPRTVRPLGGPFFPNNREILRTPNLDTACIPLHGPSPTRRERRHRTNRGRQSVEKRWGLRWWDVGLRRHCSSI